MKPKLLNAWFSKNQKECAGYCIYERANGERVEVTAVSNTKDHGCAWDDLKPVGKVTKCILSYIKNFTRL